MGRTRPDIPVGVFTESVRKLGWVWKKIGKGYAYCWVDPNKKNFRWNPRCLPVVQNTTEDPE